MSNLIYGNEVSINGCGVGFGEFFLKEFWAANRRRGVDYARLTQLWIRRALYGISRSFNWNGGCDNFDFSILRDEDLDSREGCFHGIGEGLYYAPKLFDIVRRMETDGIVGGNWLAWEADESTKEMYLSDGRVLNFMSSIWRPYLLLWRRSFSDLDLRNDIGKFGRIFAEYAASRGVEGAAEALEEFTASKDEDVVEVDESGLNWGEFEGILWILDFCNRSTHVNVIFGAASNMLREGWFDIDAWSASTLYAQKYAATLILEYLCSKRLTCAYGVSEAGVVSTLDILDEMTKYVYGNLGDIGVYRGETTAIMAESLSDAVKAAARASGNWEAASVVLAGLEKIYDIGIAGSDTVEKAAAKYILADLETLHEEAVELTERCKGFLTAAKACYAAGISTAEKNACIHLFLGAMELVEKVLGLTSATGGAAAYAEYIGRKRGIVSIPKGAKISNVYRELLECKFQASLMLSDGWIYDSDKKNMEKIVAAAANLGEGEDIERAVKEKYFRDGDENKECVFPFFSTVGYHDFYNAQNETTKYKDVISAAPIDLRELLEVDKGKRYKNIKNTAKKFSCHTGVGMSLEDYMEIGLEQYKTYGQYISPEDIKRNFGL